MIDIAHRASQACRALMAVYENDVVVSATSDLLEVQVFLRWFSLRLLGRYTSKLGTVWGGLDRDCPTSSTIPANLSRMST